MYPGLKWTKETHIEDGCEERRMVLAWQITPFLKKLYYIVGVFCPAYLFAAISFVRYRDGRWDFLALTLFLALLSANGILWAFAARDARRAEGYSFEITRKGITKRGRTDAVHGDWSQLKKYGYFSRNLRFSNGVVIRLAFSHMVVIPTQVVAHIAKLSGVDSPLSAELVRWASVITPAYRRVIRPVLESKKDFFGDSVR